MRQASEDGLRMVRADMCRRLNAIEAKLSGRGGAGIRAEAESIATLAADYGLAPARRLAEGLSVALGAGGRGSAVQPWIERLRDAIDCEGIDGQASDALMASIMVRFAG